MFCASLPGSSLSPASIDLPASSLVAYSFSPVLYWLPIPSRATHSTLPSCPYRFPVSSRANRPTFPPRPCHFPASSRAVQPTLPLVRSVSRSVVRYSFGVSSRPSRLPFSPVSRFLRSPFFLLPGTIVLDDEICFWRFPRQTVILGFGLTHLCCAYECVHLCIGTKLNFWFLFS